LILKTKKNILVFTDWYLPAYKAGGPVKSIAAMVFYLKDEFNFYIVTGNKDAFSAEPYQDVKSTEWHILANGEKVYYFSDEVFSMKNLKALLKEITYETVYLNSFFSKRFTLYPLWLKKKGGVKTPIVLAPRGMLGAGALSLKSKKKNIFISSAKAIGLYNNIVWHATSLQEENEIKQVFGKQTPIHTVSNLILPPVQSRIEYDKEEGQVRICFVSRITEKKNLLFALEVLQGIKTGRVIFDIYGPAENQPYLEACMDAAEKVSANVSVSFKGDLQGNQVEESLKKYHLFFLPTLNENFGHAIIEAMLNGCLPLISTETPWRNLQLQNIGWDIALTEKQHFAAAIQEALQMPQAEFEKKSKAVAQYARLHGLDKANIRSYINMFSALAR
jgi:glycosyltransferase involved in cell wall biosynthesis